MPDVVHDASDPFIPGDPDAPFARRCRSHRLADRTGSAADQEQQLVTWLSKRLGTPIHAPALKPVGYELIGGRLLPGETGPVAQFTYHDASGQRLTLYVTREPPKSADGAPTAFRFGQDGPVNVFYWVDKDVGYALSSSADRLELTRVAHEVYRQLGGG